MIRKLEQARGRGRRPLHGFALGEVLLIGLACIVAQSAVAARKPVLAQIDLPHNYYYREMYLPQLTTGPSALTFSPDGKILVTGSPNGETVFRDAQTGEDVATLGDSSAGLGVYALAFSPDGQLLAAGLSDQSVRLFKLK